MCLILVDLFISVEALWAVSFKYKVSRVSITLIFHLPHAKFHIWVEATLVTSV